MRRRSSPGPQNEEIASFGDASVAGYFVAGEGTDTMADVKTRLDAIERKLDALLADRDR